MTQEAILKEITGKELHFRLLSNDLLARGKKSVTAVTHGASAEAFFHNASFQIMDYRNYSPRTVIEKLLDKIKGNNSATPENPNIYVIVEEKGGNISPDDVRYVEWLSDQKSERPRILMLPEQKDSEDCGEDSSRQLLNEKDETELRAASFWKRQARRIRALPAPITKDAAIVAIPRTLIPVFFIILLAYVKRNDVLLQRVTAYIGLTFGFSVGFALISQTLLNWVTFCGEFTRDLFEPSIDRLENWFARHGQLPWLAKNFIALLSFVSARGDVLIAWPTIGIFSTYLARLVLGPMGETASVLSLRGFLMVVDNVVVGTVAGGPYTQMLAHLRAVGKISDRASLYLQIIETIKMELGRTADFGMQTLYHLIQIAIATVCWLFLFLFDRLYPKPHILRLEHPSDIDCIQKLFDKLRTAEDVLKALPQQAIGESVQAKVQTSPDCCA